MNKITIGRVYNLGNYEHIRYELTHDVREGESATTAIIGMERIINALKPDRSVKSISELRRMSDEIERMKTMSLAEFEKQYGIYGVPSQRIAEREKEYEEQLAKTVAYDERQKKARELFDDLGGASQWKDAKYDWEDDDQ